MLVLTMNFLRRHPFPVVAHFERVIAVSFAFPETVLRPLVPDILELDTYEGLGFITVALVWTRKLRPAGFPAFLGQDFLLSGYRIFTRFQDPTTGRRLRGLKNLRSETDKQRMVRAGNLFTRYNYHHVHARLEDSGTLTHLQTCKPDGTPAVDMIFDAKSENVPLREGSPFPDWRTARKFAGPMPFTFSAEDDGSCVIIEGRRSSWTPRPVAVKEWKVSFFEESPLTAATPILANAFAVENIDYGWKSGRVVTPA